MNIVYIHTNYTNVNYPFIIKMIYLNEVKRLQRLNPIKYKRRYNILNDFKNSSDIGTTIKY